MKNIVKYFSFSDKKLFYIFNGTLKCKLLDIIMPYITKLGGAFFTIVSVLLLIVLGKDKVRIIGFESLTSLTASHLLVQILKRTISRIRPYDILKNINTFNITLEDYSFPSGHTTAIFSIAIVLSLNIPSFMIPAIFIATLVGFSRIYLGVHYPSDVVVGIILGSMTSILTHSTFVNYVI
ncbi:phosphatase PAP2 family protein [Thermohalobacter berrensis]|uniref:Phospholipid phosphatase n=1 Tax=Thermohalobacter berrensis TaxID=99594 RepID=A0A419T1E8_9FIRM|nr:phosphatase PAP2 family protein [Thermohalobacter berrensis]RKD31241.1 phospholipid phosphatase [Thermohalobacter berrensis]